MAIKVTKSYYQKRLAPSHETRDNEIVKETDKAMAEAGYSKATHCTLRVPKWYMTYRLIESKMKRAHREVSEEYPDEVV